MLTAYVFVTLVIYVVIAVWRVRKAREHSIQLCWAISIAFIIGFVVLVLVYSKAVYHEWTGTFYTEIRSYEVVSYNQKKSRPIIMLRDVKTNKLLYNTKSCGVTTYEIGDIVQLNTDVAEYSNSIDLTLILRNNCL